MENKSPRVSVDSLRRRTVSLGVLFFVSIPVILLGLILAAGPYILAAIDALGSRLASQPDELVRSVSRSATVSQVEGSDGSSLLWTVGVLGLGVPVLANFLLTRKRCRECRGKRTVTCGHCSGKGTREDEAGAVVLCPVCAGAGRVPCPVYLDPNSAS